MDSVTAARNEIRKREGDFLTILVSGSADHVIPNSAMASVLVDALAKQEPTVFLEAMETWKTEVA